MSLFKEIQCMNGRNFFYLNETFMVYWQNVQLPMNDNNIVLI